MSYSTLPDKTASHSAAPLLSSPSRDVADTAKATQHGHGAEAEAQQQHKEEEEMPPQLPTGDRGYFACRTCRRILSEPQWYTEGCTECMTGPVPRSDLAEYATAHFHNFVGLVAPEKSWVARLIGKTHSPNGVYAEAISGSERDENDDDDDDDDDADEVDEADDAHGNKKDVTAAHATASRMTDDELLNMH